MGVLKLLHIFSAPLEGCSRTSYENKNLPCYSNISSSPYLSVIFVYRRSNVFLQALCTWPNALSKSLNSSYTFCAVAIIISFGDIMFCQLAPCNFNVLHHFSPKLYGFLSSSKFWIHVRHFVSSTHDKCRNEGDCIENEIGFVLAAYLRV